MKIAQISLLFLCTTLFLVSCKKDDDTVSGEIAGEWKLSEFKCDNCKTTLDAEGQNTFFTSKFSGKNFNAFTTFTENPNQFNSTGEYTLVTTTTVAGFDTTTEIEVDAFQDTGTWSISGDKITQVYAGTATEFTILELSNTKLRLRYELDGVSVDGGTTFNFGTVYSSYTRN